MSAHRAGTVPVVQAAARQLRAHLRVVEQVHQWDAGTTPQGMADPDCRFTRYICQRCDVACDYFYNRENNGATPATRGLTATLRNMGQCSARRI